MQSFSRSATCRTQSFDGLEDPIDRPLIAQFAGNDPDMLVRAARYVEHQVDAVDGELGNKW